MKIRGRVIFLLITIIWISCDISKEDRWIQLFNGEDLEDWKVKVTNYPLGDNPGNLFRVEEGLLKVRYAESDTFNSEFGHLFYQKPFTNYHLRAEYRFVGEQVPGSPDWAYKNNGLMIHSQSPESMAFDQQFPISLEVQLLGAERDSIRPTGNLCTPGTSVQIDGIRPVDHCIESDGPTISDDSWVLAEAIVYGDSIIHHLINGDTVMTYYKPMIDSTEIEYIQKGRIQSLALGSGFISIQAETHPTDFRKIELLELNK